MSEPKSSSGLLGVLGGVIAEIAAHRDDADEQARMAPAVVRLGREAGIFTIGAPRENGGREPDLVEFTEVFELLGWADPTVAWHAGNSAITTRATAYLDDEHRRMVFDGPGPFGFSGVPAGVAQPVEGGYELRGRWPFLTGVLDASWAAVLGIVYDGDGPREHLGGPDVRLFYVPGSTWCVEPTWDTATAMRGTGSHAISIAGAFVPEGLTANLAAPLRVDRALFRLPLPVAGPRLNAAIALGIARRAADEIISTITTKLVRGDGSPFRDRERNQQVLAGAAAETRLLRDGQVAAAAAVWQAAQAGPIPLEARAALWSTSYVIIDRCRVIISDLAALASSSFYTHRNPVESAVRDIHAICASIDALRPLQEDAGRVLLGLEPLHPMF